MESVVGVMLIATCTSTRRGSDIVTLSLAVAVTVTPHGLTGSAGVDGGAV
jgi:hypothetical protein